MKPCYFLKKQQKSTIYLICACHTGANGANFLTTDFATAVEFCDNCCIGAQTLARRLMWSLPGNVMSQNDEVVKTIQHDPGNEEARLVYADWLDENDNPHAADYLRVELKLGGLALNAPEAKPLRDRLWQAWANVDPRWLAVFTQPRMLLANPTPFPAVWTNFSLGKLRPGMHTYDSWPYASLPPLSIEEMFDEFRYIRPGTRKPDQTEVEQHDRAFRKMLRRADEMPSDLPPTFLQFMQHIDWHHAFHSPTDCYFTLPDKCTRIRRNPDDKGFHIHFYCDSQSCVLWDLYLHPSGGHCVIARHFDYFEPIQEPEEPKDNRPQIWFVAPSFDAFVYRTWLENQVCSIARSDIVQGELLISPAVTPAIQAYVDHYRTGGTRGTQILPRQPI